MAIERKYPRPRTPEQEALRKPLVEHLDEEEASALQIVERLRMIGDDSAALLILDAEMGARTTAG